MANRTIRDIERQANLQAGMEVQRDSQTNHFRKDDADFGALTYSSIARALANRYDSIYYVNLSDNRYVEYTSSDEYRNLKIEIEGEDFFEDSARNIRRVVHPDDQAFALMVHKKEYILKALEKDKLLSFTYRIMFDGVPHYYNGRMSRGDSDDRDHLIIGWANVDSEVSREREFESTANENHLTKSINRALLSDYVKIFYVDLTDGSYIEYIPDQEGSELTISHTGADFFEYARAYGETSINLSDRERFQAAFQRENIPELLEGGPFAITYRHLADGHPVWHILTALYADARTHLLISIRNIDAQKRLEADYEQRLHSMSILVNRDAMTKVKNKKAFNEEEALWDQLLARGADGGRFAVAVCDVNDLKRVNDTCGHSAGDKIIIDAARIISDTFKHSPVFRIGGDEFAVVLSDRDYDNRSRLMDVLEERVRRNRQEGRVVLASGIAAFDGGVDRCFADVVKRADAKMYENKRALKREEA